MPQHDDEISRFAAHQVDMWCAHHDIRINDGQRAAFIELIDAYERLRLAYQVRHKEDRNRMWLMSAIAFPIGAIVGYAVSTIM